MSKVSPNNCIYTETLISFLVFKLGCWGWMLGKAAAPSMAAKSKLHVKRIRLLNFPRDFSRQPPYHWSFSAGQIWTKITIFYWWKAPECDGLPCLREWRVWVVMYWKIPEGIVESLALLMSIHLYILKQKSPPISLPLIMSHLFRISADK